MGRPKGEGSMKVARFFIVMFTFILVIGVAAPALSASWTQMTSGELIKPLQQVGDNVLEHWDGSTLAAFEYETFGYSDDSFFGVRPDATEGFDLAYDWQEPPAPPAPPYIRNYFYYSANPSGYRELNKSIIGSGNTRTWTYLRVDVYVPESEEDQYVDVTLSWDVSGIPTSFSLSLYKGATLVADMRAVSSYNYSQYIETGYTMGRTTFKIVATLTDTTPPATPSLVSPENGAELLDNTPTFEWTSVEDPSGVIYDIQVDDSEDFGSPVYSVVDLTTTTITLPDEYALALGKYYWRVRAKDWAGNVGDWSEEWNFTVVPIGAIGAVLMPLVLLLPLVLMLRRQNRRYY